MDNYQGYPNFITNYEVDEENNKITIQYADGEKSTIIFSEHNIHAVEERLHHQHLTIMEKELPEWESEIKKRKIALFPFATLAGLGIASGSLFSSLFPLYFMGIYGCVIYKNRGLVRRLKLTDYCLKNADSIKLTKDSSNSHLQLSDAGEKAFELDHGFSLNHAHLYTNHDLKVLKKVSSQESLHE